MTEEGAALRLRYRDFDGIVIRQLCDGLVVSRAGAELLKLMRAENVVEPQG